MKIQFKKLKLGIIGLGYWGRNYLRLMATIPTIEIVAIADINPQVLGSAPTESTFYSDYIEMIQKNDFDAIIIATPAATHKGIAITALEKGIHLLVEKPMACSASDASLMIQKAGENNCILMIGHTFLYNNYIEHIKKFIDSTPLQEISKIKSVRTHKGLVREDISCVWDLATHDISIVNFILNKLPHSVSATGDIGKDGILKKVGTSKIHLFYSNDPQIDIHVSWDREVKERSLMISGKELSLKYEILDGKDFLRINNNEIDIFSTEPLLNQLNHFIGCIKNKTAQKTEGNVAIHTIHILEAIDQSILSNGELVPVNYNSTQKDKRYESMAV